jgi:hypothetical protein
MRQTTLRNRICDLSLHNSSWMNEIPVISKFLWNNGVNLRKFAVQICDTANLYIRIRLNNTSVLYCTLQIIVNTKIRNI